MRARLTRRAMLKTSASAAALTVVPASAARSYAANEKANIGVVGAGIGGHNAKVLADLGQNIAALCEVDRRRLEGWAKRYPQAKPYTDFRKMLDDQKLDGIVVATPDHTHAVISLRAMRMGVHCFCQKPLTHNVREARLMAEVAAAKKLSTQMGTNSQDSPHQLQVKKLIRSGALGGVTEVHVSTNRPIWLQGADRPANVDSVPEGLDWDLWLGPAPLRPYAATWPAAHPARKLATFKHQQVYHPFVWRGWWDFGTGALGDIAPHAMNSVYFALDLGAPQAVEVVASSGVTREMFPEWEIIRFDFPARGDQPPVKVFWYDGGKRPPAEIGDDGPVYIGTKGSLPAGRGPFFGRKADSPPLPEVAPGEWQRLELHADWIRGIRTGKPTGCGFGYAGPFTESYLLGNIALRVGQRIHWDPTAFRITNCESANAHLGREYRKGWEL